MTAATRHEASPSDTFRELSDIVTLLDLAMDAAIYRDRSELAACVVQARSKAWALMLAAKR